MSPVRTLDKVRVWEEVVDNGAVKYAPYEQPQLNPNKKYFKGNM